MKKILLRGSTILTILWLLGFSFSLHGQEAQQRYYPVEDPLVKKKLEQWQDLKFGLLMHWGPYSQWGVVESWSICSEDQPWCYRGEDYAAYKQKYEQLILTFNPTDFDPLPWAQAANEAGMKYVVFTTKHHDGFCMFDTRTTEYKITAGKCPYHTNPRADVTRAIFDAFRQQGFMVGAYFSKPDWHSEYFWWPKFATPDRNVNYDIGRYPERWQQFVNYTHNQVKELMSNYGNMDILWLDGGWVQPLKPEEIVFSQTLNSLYSERGYTMLRIPQNQDVQMDKLVADARLKQPGLIVVDRAVEGPNQNYLTPEQTIPHTWLPYPWETCMTMGGSWSFKPDDTYKSARQLIHTLADIVSKGGNLLLNIGPGPDGKWDQKAYDRLKEIGSWMKINSEAIYNTRGMEHFEEGRFRFTRGQNGKFYAIYLAEEGDRLPEQIVITSLMPSNKASVRLLGSSAEVRWEKCDNGAVIHLPKTGSLPPASSYAWVLSFSGFQESQ